MKSALRLVAAPILFLAAGCDLIGQRTVSEQELLVAKCAIVEQVGIWSGFLGGDADYTLGVRCAADPQDFREILTSRNSARFGLAKGDSASNVQSVEVFYCEPSDRERVEGRLAALNEISAQTGFRFELSPIAANCPNHFAGKDMITDTRQAD